MTFTMDTKEKLILTFGYGNRKDYDVFLKYIDEFKIAYVIDVRLSPKAWTRKWYGDAIEKICQSVNIQYLAKPTLGNTSGRSNWIPPEPTAAAETLSELAKILASNGNVLLLCAELDYSRCHRVEVAEELEKLTNAAVKHLP
jgi:uncharacterized protein (DUF488 family)